MTEHETTEAPRAACPSCGRITLSIEDTGWRAFTRYRCTATGCDYFHDISHGAQP